MRRATFIALLTASAAAPAAAELVLDGVRWQAARAGAPRAETWADVEAQEDGPPKLDSRLRGKLILKNRGPKPAEGILVRYALSARIAPDAGGDAAWGVPFAVETKRVPAVKPNQVLEVPVQLGLAVGDYLKRVSRAGWWPDRLRIQAMIEPRAGDAVVQTAEGVLELRR